MNAMPGGIFAGYEIQGVLGRGGMGTVYAAQHPRLPRLIALKLLNQDVAADPELRARFEREATLVARLDHPGIVSVLDRGIEDGQPWLAMQYIQGTDTTRLDPRTLTVERAVRIIGEVASALDYAHGQGILHRDVKPANILLTTAEAGRMERAVLTDFGIGRLLASNTQLTSSGTFVATLAYAAPEQLSGDPVDARSDQYSLACTLFALLTGHAPFAGTDPGQVVTGHLVKPVPPIGRPDVPPRLNTVVARAMAKHPAERFRSAGEFAAAAAAVVVQGQSGIPYPPGAPTIQYRPQPPVSGFVPADFPAAQFVGNSAPPLYDAGTARRSPWGAVWALVLGCFLVGFSSSGLVSGYSEIFSDLNAGSDTMDWLTLGNLLAFTVPLLVGGRLGDRFGPKNIYLIGLAGLILSSAGCFPAASMWWIIAGYAIQGLSAGLMLPQTLAVIIRTFPADRRGAALGLWAGAAGLATLLGPVAGALLIERWSWRAIFVAGIPIGLIALALAAVLVPALPAQRRRTDPIGLLLSAVALGLLTFGLSEGTNRGWGDPRVLGPVLAGAVLLGLFMLVQARTSAESLVAAQVFRNRNVVLSNLAAMAACAALASTTLPLFFYLQEVQGFSSLKSALVLAPAAVVAAICAPIAGSISDRAHPVVVPAVGFAFYGAAVLGFVALISARAPSLAFAVPGAVAGLAIACTWASLAAMATRALPAPGAGTGAGVHLAARQLGAMIGAAASGTVLTNAISDAYGGAITAFVAAVRTAMLTTLVFVLLGGIAAAFLTRGRSAAGDVQAGFSDGYAETVNGHRPQ
ncbi:MDR family MFS transporter [Nocardia sp. NBC_01388]|uniref:MDR family MFS transporter n=1 Tax=Nocardia sp. NBC_01388 TaxID=2903596 RepID=UPI0032482BB8